MFMLIHSKLKCNFNVARKRYSLNIAKKKRVYIHLVMNSFCDLLVALGVFWGNKQNLGHQNPRVGPDKEAHMNIVGHTDSRYFNIDKNLPPAR